MALPEDTLSVSKLGAQAADSSPAVCRSAAPLGHRSHPSLTVAWAWTGELWGHCPDTQLISLLPTHQLSAAASN